MNIGLTLAIVLIIGIICVSIVIYHYITVKHVNCDNCIYNQDNKESEGV